MNAASTEEKGYRIIQKEIGGKKYLVLMLNGGTCKRIPVGHEPEQVTRERWAREMAASDHKPIK